MSCVGAGWAIIGETAKWVPVNNMRFANIEWDHASVTVVLRGVENEAVEVSTRCCSAGFPWLSSLVSLHVSCFPAVVLQHSRLIAGEG